MDELTRKAVKIEAQNAARIKKSVRRKRLETVTQVISGDTKSGKHRKHTPYVSKAQATAGNIALGVRKGKLPKSKLKGASKQMARGMTMKELESHSAEAKGKKLPKRAKKTNPRAGTPEGYKAGLGGQKIRSKGKGRGLGRGKGKGPIGKPFGSDEGKAYIKDRKKQRNKRAG